MEGGKSSGKGRPVQDSGDAVYRAKRPHLSEEPPIELGSPSPSPLLALPRDLWHLIIAALDLVSSARFRMASKAFRALGWGRLGARNRRWQGLPPVGWSLARLFPMLEFVKEMQLPSVLFFELPSLDPLRRFTALESLALEGPFWGKQPLDSIASLSLLTHLAVSVHVQYASSFDGLAAAVAHLTRLRSLTFSISGWAVDLPAVAKALPVLLDRLAIHCPVRLNVRQVDALLPFLSRVDALELDWSADDPEDPGVPLPPIVYSLEVPKALQLRTQSLPRTLTSLYIGGYTYSVAVSDQLPLLSSLQQLTWVCSVELRVSDLTCLPLLTALCWDARGNNVEGGHLRYLSALRSLHLFTEGSLHDFVGGALATALTSLVLSEKVNVSSSTLFAMYNLRNLEAHERAPFLRLSDLRSLSLLESASFVTSSDARSWEDIGSTLPCLRKLELRIVNQEEYPRLALSFLSQLTRLTDLSLGPADIRLVVSDLASLRRLRRLKIYVASHGRLDRPLWISFWQTFPELHRLELLNVRDTPLQ